MPSPQLANSFQALANFSIIKQIFGIVVMPQSRYRSGGFTPPFSGCRGKPAATFEIETEALRIVFGAVEGQGVLEVLDSA
jgi:hypothetical protein